ncbi:MAG TPA: DUF4390 domain-containing protein [Candidatus Competibacteraceae bacterium]|nr:DUF4390 domain-containing protein [Gammaproteobacteria bacterium]HPF59242.1 DUF4390 domain-containing protein [Candidatus Competibacteraceae bacterium]
MPARLLTRSYRSAAISCLAVLLSFSVAWAAGFDIISASTRLEGGVYRLSAQIEYRFSQATVEALKNGVPLTVELEMEVRRQRWVWDETVYALSQRFRLEYHTLSRQYLVTNLNSGERRAFPNQGSALQFMGKVIDFPLLDKGLLVPNQRYIGALRVQLDVNALPTPLRLFAYISDDWQLASKWLTWQL